MLSSAVALVSTANDGYGYVANGTMPALPFIARGMAVDGSGALWIAGRSATSLQQVTEVVGVAAPVVTPLSVAAQTNTLETRP